MKKNKKYALISTYNKIDLDKICKIFDFYNIGMISTGSTALHIKRLGFDCQLISNLTNFKEILGGRVKTLHPNIHSSLLFDRKNKSHIKTFKSLNFPIIDFVVVNLYPFKKASEKSNNEKNIIDMIDIGGPALLRSASKNFKFMTTLIDIADYDIFVDNLIKNKGKTNLKFRKIMAQKVFETTALYDKQIANWFLNSKRNFLKFDQINKIDLKYGENPNQKSFFYNEKKHQNIFNNKINGKKIGYNNVLDLDAGLNCLNEFLEPTCVIIKHNNPCGVASGKIINQAYKKALEGDNISAFGGIVTLNRVVNEKLATEIIKNFYEIIAAPRFSIKAKKLLKTKKNLILINTKKLKVSTKNELKSVIGGYLFQKPNLTKISKNMINCVSIFKAKKKLFEDLIFALKVCKHVKSNAIVLVKNKQTIGIGAGQMSRVDSTNLAIRKIGAKFKTLNYVAASDAFFPFTDSIKKLQKNHCIGLVQPSGSINDNKIINFVNNNKMFLYFSKYRLFKH